jgi:hypothetical protein
MRIGFYCESPADQAAMAVFAEGMLGAPPEPINIDLEARPQPAFFTVLDGAFRGVHYNSDAEGLVIVSDCDDADLHNSAHDESGVDSGSCRLCKARKIIDKARRQLKPRQGQPPLKVAIGLAVPAIEAWYLCGKHHQVGEASWLMRLSFNQPSFNRRQLKTLAYGTDRPSLEQETECAIREARRIIGNLKTIEDAFPIGFGLMAKEIRSWTASV